MNNREPSNVQPSERDWVALAAAGRKDAQRTLFELYREAAYAVALRISGRHEDAMDVVQDAFIKAFENLHAFQHESGFKTWLLRIVSNRALDLLRARKVRLAVSLRGGDDDERDAAPEIARGQDPSEPLERSERAARIRAALETLPPEQRAVVALYGESGMTYGQIAETLGVPIGTVMSRLFHARRKLQAQLGETTE